MEEQEKFQELGLSYLYLDLIVFKVLITQAEQPGFKIWLFFLFFLFFRVQSQIAVWALLRMRH